MSDILLGLLGGLMIGCAGAAYLLINGRIMGASSIVGGLLDGTGSASWAERTMFLVGLIGAPAVASLFFDMPNTHVSGNLGLLVVAGVLVGLGTRLGSGCTSGHGVCGMSRLSIRSIISTLIYISAGVMMVVIAKNIGVI